MADFSEQPFLFDSQKDITPLPLSLPTKSNRKPLKIALVTIGVLFSAAAAFGLGYYLKYSQKPAFSLTAADQTKDIDIGEVLFKKFGKDETAEAGTIKFEFWLDSDLDGKRSQWEVGNQGMGINVRRKGEKLPFTSLETDGEGIISLSGLNNGDFEVEYYLSPYSNEYFSNAETHFIGSKYYKIFTSSDGSTGMLPTTWTALKAPAEGEKITIGIQEYKPKQLLALQNKQLVLYDLDTKLRFDSSNIFDNQNFPKKFEVRDNKIFYVKGGVLYKYDPFNSYNGQSEVVYDKIVAPDDSYYAISQKGTAIIYGGHDGTFFQNADSACGKQMLRFNNKPIEMFTTSYPYDPIFTRFQDETHALVYEKANDNQNNLYTIACDGTTLNVKKLPINLDYFRGGYVANSRIVMKGPVTYKKPCVGDGACDVAVNYGEGLYAYDLTSDNLSQIGQSEFNKTELLNISGDGKYVTFVNYENGLVKIVDFSSKDQTKILDVDLMKNLKDPNPSKLRDTTIAYIGNDNFLFFDVYGECGKENDCAVVKKFNITGGNISAVQDVMTIKDIYPLRLTGELSNEK